MGRLAQLDTRRMDRLIKTLGQVPQAWFRYNGECPRHTSTGYNMDPLTEPDCPLCGGTMQLYERMALPLTGKTSGRIATLQATEKNKKSPVEVPAGSLIAVFNPDDYPLGPSDRIVLATRKFHFAQKLKRGTGSGDRLQYVPAVTVESVVTPDGPVTTGFHLDATGEHLRWTAYPGDPGSFYTVRYSYHPGYMVDGNTLHHRETAPNGDAFPSRCTLVLWQNSPLDTMEGQRV